MDKIDATRLLRDDHKKVKGLFTQFDVTDERAPEMKEGIVSEIFMELEVHTGIEEEFFYPAIRDSGDEYLRSLIQQSFDDHAEMKKMIQGLRLIDVYSENFDDRFEDLMEEVELHVDDEEQDLFPRVEQVLSEKLMELGTQMKARKEELMRKPEYQFAQADVVQNPHGGEQMRKRAA